MKVREGAVRVQAVYLAIGIGMSGEKKVLGLEAKFWLKVVTELRNRSVQGIFIACVDGLKGFPEYLPIGQSGRRNWSRLTPFFGDPPEIRKDICTTSAIESVKMGLRKLAKNRGSFPGDEALTQLFHQALRNIRRKWTLPIRDGKAALTPLTIQCGDRIFIR